MPQSESNEYGQQGQECRQRNRISLIRRFNRIQLLGGVCSITQIWLHSVVMVMIYWLGYNVHLKALMVAFVVVYATLSLVSFLIVGYAYRIRSRYPDLAAEQKWNEPRPYLVLATFTTLPMLLLVVRPQ